MSYKSFVLLSPCNYLYKLQIKVNIYVGIWSNNLWIVESKTGTWEKLGCNLSVLHLVNVYLLVLLV